MSISTNFSEKDAKNEFLCGIDLAILNTSRISTFFTEQVAKEQVVAIFSQTTEETMNLAFEYLLRCDFCQLGMMKICCDEMLIQLLVNRNIDTTILYDTTTFVPAETVIGNELSTERIEQLSCGILSQSDKIVSLVQTSKNILV